MLIMINSYK